MLDDGTALDTDHALTYAEALSAERDAEAQYRRVRHALTGEDFDRAVLELQEARGRRHLAERRERGEPT